MPHPFLKQPTIHIARSVAASFRKRAWLAFPNEYAEFIWGWHDQANIYVVTTVNVKQKGTPDKVDLDEVEDRMAVEEAWEHDLNYLGLWHTHPVGKREPEYMKSIYTMLSTQDHECASAAGDIVWPVTVMWTNEGKKHSRTRWWFPQAEMEVKWS